MSELMDTLKKREEGSQAMKEFMAEWDYWFARYCGDPRTLDQKCLDEWQKEVQDTRESDRPL